MPSHTRTAHLLPAGIAGLGASLAIAAAMVGTAAAAPAQDFGTHDFRGSQDFRAAQSDVGLSALTAPAQDFGTQDWRGSQDFRAAESAAALSVDALSAPRITAALQPGQTDSLVTSGNYSGSVGDQVPWAPASGPTSALQPGQTDSLVTSGNYSGSVGGATSLTSVLGTTSAPQPGQTGW
jgi:hypothetical protein